MRHRPTVMVVSALTVISLAACGKDDDAAAPKFEQPPAAAVVPGASAAPGAASTAPGSSAAADPGAASSPGATRAGTTGPGSTTSGPSKKPGGTPAGRPASSNDSVSAAGLGPYEIGVRQKDLRSAGLLGRVSTSDACATSTGDDRYHSPKLTFRDGKLQRLRVTSKAVVTTTGARVGTSYAQVKGMYPAGKQLTDWVGASGWLTADGEYALLFHIKGGKVAIIEAGQASPLQFAFTDNQTC